MGQSISGLSKETSKAEDCIGNAFHNCLKLPLESLTAVTNTRNKRASENETAGFFVTCHLNSGKANTRPRTPGG